MMWLAALRMPRLGCIGDDNGDDSRRDENVSCLNIHLRSHTALSPTAYIKHLIGELIGRIAFRIATG